MTAAAAAYAAPAFAGPRATEFHLANGMQVIVVPDHRAPVVTHMVWYRVGGADEPRGRSGIAHFLEHLMFKGTDKIPAGQFSKIIAKNGGQDNAFTTQDVTGYHQNVAKDRLPLVMEMEADRMTGLKLAEPDVLTERDVILEERRSRVGNNPSGILSEQMLAALYLNHPYGTPVIGWEHEVAALSRADALEYYGRFYAPNNAILVVAGDVEPDDVLKLAEATYGKIAAKPAVARGKRATEPAPVAPRRITIVDARAGQAMLDRNYLAPTYRTAGRGEAEALEVLMKILGSGATSRLYKSLIVDKKLAASVGAYYSGSAIDYGRLGVYGIAAEGVALADLEAGIDTVIAEVVSGGVTEAELKRAKTAYLADYIYEADGQSNLARRYGWAIATGSSVEDVESWPERLKSVTLDDIKAATRHLDLKASVTGWLLPPATKN